MRDAIDTPKIRRRDERGAFTNVGGGRGLRGNLGFNLKRTSDRTRAGAIAALREEAEALLVDANTRVPVDIRPRDEHEHAGPCLKESGEVVGEGAKVSVAYSARHALPVHERIEVHHVIGMAKWLEFTMDLRSAQMAKRMARKVKAWVSG